MSKILPVFLALALVACGTKGALVLPPGNAPAPLLGNPSAPVLVGADGSTTKESAR